MNRSYCCIGRSGDEDVHIKGLELRGGGGFCFGFCTRQLSYHPCTGTLGGKSRYCCPCCCWLTLIPGKPFIYPYRHRQGNLHPPGTRTYPVASPSTRCNKPANSPVSWWDRPVATYRDGGARTRQNFTCLRRMPDFLMTFETKVERKGGLSCFTTTYTMCNCPTNTAFRWANTGWCAKPLKSILRQRQISISNHRLLSQGTTYEQHTVQNTSSASCATCSQNVKTATSGFHGAQRV